MSKKQNNSNILENEQVESSRANVFIENGQDALNVKEDYIEAENIPNFDSIETVEEKEEEKEEEKVEEKINDVEKQEVKEEIKEEIKEEKKEVKRLGKVDAISSKYILVKDEDGYYYKVYNHPEAKYGDVIEF